jgi:hypothetical protein
VKKLIPLIRKYVLYAKHLASTNAKNFERFKSWMHTYISYKSNETKFSPTYLPKYEQGQIIFVDFGCGIRHEFSYPHYAIVLNTKDRKKNDLLTVVPLTSKKEKHNTLKEWEHEISYPIKNLLIDKVLSDFNLYGDKYVQLRDKVIAFAKNSSSLSKDEYAKRYSALVDAGVKEIYSSNRDVMDFAEKMAKGTIVELNQIKTISKSRIIFPVKKSHALYDIKIHPADLISIHYALMSHIILGKEYIDNQ